MRDGSMSFRNEVTCEVSQHAEDRRLRMGEQLITEPRRYFAHFT